jgi:molybdenum cofactor biosynthesis enzyme MoaA
MAGFGLKLGKDDEMTGRVLAEVANLDETKDRVRPKITSRIDAITELPPSYMVTKPPCPRSCKIELTARCNFQCRFCARSMRLRQQGDMDRQLFERLLPEMRQAGVEEIGLFYLGESLLCKWLADAVFFAKKKAEFPYVFLTTNGSLATPSTVGALVGAGLDSLKFSLNYANENQFAEIARVKKALYVEIKDNIMAARDVRDAIADETGHHCGLYASYILYDDEQAVLMAETVDELRPYLDEIYELPLYNQASLVTEEEKAQGWRPTPGNRGRAGALRNPLPCGACFTEAHITYDGKLSACCFDHTNDFEMADLTETSFLEGWHSGAFADLRTAHLARDVRNTPCDQCVACS